MAAIKTTQGLDEHTKAIGLIIELCKESFGHRLTSIILYGSVALEDSVLDYSDLDIMLVIEDHLRGPKDHEILKSIKNKVSQRAGVDIHEAWVFGKSLLLSVPTLWETLSARTIYGEPVIEEAPLPELHVRTSIKMMRDLRSCWERRAQALELEEKAKTALGYTLKFAQNALLYLDIVTMKKAEIVAVFEEKFNSFSMRSSPRIAYERILRWKEISMDDHTLNAIVDEYERFSDNLFWYIGLRTLFEE